MLRGLPRGLERKVSKPKVFIKLEIFFSLNPSWAYSKNYLLIMTEKNNSIENTITVHESINLLKNNLSKEKENLEKARNDFKKKNITREEFDEAIGNVKGLTLVIGQLNNVPLKEIRIPEGKIQSLTEVQMMLHRDQEKLNQNYSLLFDNIKTLKDENNTLIEDVFDRTNELLKLDKTNKKYKQLSGGVSIENKKHTTNSGKTVKDMKKDQNSENKTGGSKRKRKFDDTDANRTTKKHKASQLDIENEGKVKKLIRMLEDKNPQKEETNNLEQTPVLANESQASENTTDKKNVSPVEAKELLLKDLKEIKEQINNLPPTLGEFKELTSKQVSIENALLHIEKSNQKSDIASGLDGIEAELSPTETHQVQQNQELERTENLLNKINEKISEVYGLLETFIQSMGLQEESNHALQNNVSQNIEPQNIPEEEHHQVPTESIDNNLSEAITQFLEKLNTIQQKVHDLELQNQDRMEKQAQTQSSPTVEHESKSIKINSDFPTDKELKNMEGEDIKVLKGSLESQLGGIKKEKEEKIEIIKGLATTYEDLGSKNLDDEQKIATAYSINENRIAKREAKNALKKIEKRERDVVRKLYKDEKVVMKKARSRTESADILSKTFNGLNVQGSAAKSHFEAFKKTSIEKDPRLAGIEAKRLKIVKLTINKEKRKQQKR